MTLRKFPVLLLCVVMLRGDTLERMERSFCGERSFYCAIFYVHHEFRRKIGWCRRSDG